MGDLHTEAGLIADLNERIAELEAENARYQRVAKVLLDMIQKQLDAPRLPNDEERAHIKTLLTEFRIQVTARGRPQNEPT